MSNGYKIGDILEVAVERIVPNGFGIAFAEGLTVFVPLSAPGDRLLVKLTQIKGKTAFAEIAELISPSPVRVQPECGYFGSCGGCDFQQMSYEAQLEAKAAIIRDCLKRIGKIDVEKEIEMVPSPHEFGYRSRAQFHADGKNKKTGYYRRGSRHVIDVRDCPILTPDMQGVLSELRETMDWRSLGDKTAEFEASAAGGGVSIHSAEVSEKPREIEFEACGESFLYAADAFFQGNPYLVEPLVKTAIDGARGRLALDLYGGVGLFTLPLSRRFETVISVEGSRRAVEFAKKNVASAGIANVSVYADDVGNWLTANPESAENADFILLDPPRAGTDNATIRAIIEIGAPEISYVSCEPSVLARDLAKLTGAGYSISSITAIDLFPQTHHVETVVRLAMRD